MILSDDKKLDIFVASKIGSFKHIKYHTNPSENSKKCIENLVAIKTLEKDDDITCLEWANEDQTEILIGQKNQQIKIYNTIEGFQKSFKADFGEGHIVGLGRCKRKLIAALSSGIVKIWSKKEEVLIDTGGKLDQMRLCDEEPSLFATGGEENDLKVYRIDSQTPEFAAKNLPHDFLQLRQPVWVSGVAFMKGEAGKVAAVASRHGYVRLYDTRAQRRPVCNVHLPNMAATCIEPSFQDRCFLVGFGRGQLQQVDLRVGKPDKGYKGAAGAIADVSIAEVGSCRVVVSVSADRHIRVHDYTSKDLIYKQYLTSKLSRVLTQTKSSTPLLNPPCEESMEVKEEDDMDELFESMQAVGEKPKREEHIPSEPEAKKMKPSAEGSTSRLEDDAEDDEKEKAEAIKKLLRSTEKQKKRIEKKKKQKKAKSVFHNA